MAKGIPMERVMIFDVQPASEMLGHFDVVLAANGLQRFSGGE